MNEGQAMMNGVDVNVFAYTHSGSTYLLNILLELDVCIYRGRFDDFWHAQRDSEFQIDTGHKIDLGVWFPRFQTRDLFAFSDAIRVRWSHQWPTLDELGQRTIVMIRDPRDVLLSASKRAARDIQLSDYLHRPVLKQEHGLFSLAPAEEWALYCRLLCALVGQERLCLVKFEDLRADPRKEMARILDFLGLCRTPSAVEKAVANSSFQQVKAAAENWYRQYPGLRQGEWRAMRKGKVGEWQDEFGARESECFDGLPCRVLHDFGYAWEGHASLAPQAGVSGSVESQIPAYRLGWSAAERCDAVAAEAAFRDAAAAVDNELQATLAVGKALACCQWVKELYGTREFPSPMAGRTLQLLLESCRWLVDRPLVWVAAAKALAQAGHGRTAMQLLRQALVAAQGRYYDCCEIGMAHLRIGNKAEARAILIAAAPTATTQSELSRLGKDIIQQGAALLARDVLRAGHNTSWSRLVRETVRQNLASLLISVAHLFPAPFRDAIRRLLGMAPRRGAA